MKMCSRVLRFMATLGVFLTFAPFARAQSSQAPLHISLDQAIQLATAHNHALLAARSTIAQAKDEETTANLRPNPTLGLDYIGLPVRPSEFNWNNIKNTTEFDAG